MAKVKIMAPAKVNLVLAVGQKREDGFHKVDTLMHSLALHDTLEMRHTDLTGTGQGLTMNLATESKDALPPLTIDPESNIAYKAVMALAKALDRKEDEHIDILISKSIPHEAGLGGGSSDAAAALLGAAKLWGVDAQDPRVIEVAASLGADVRFFLQGGCAYLTGKGEDLQRVLVPRKGFVLLVRPDAGVSTPAAYNAFDENPVYADDALIEELATLENAADAPLWNNLTAPACALVPEVKEVSDWACEVLPEDKVLLCGSGSTFCLLCEDFERATELSVEAAKRGWWSRVTTFASVGATVLPPRGW